MWRGRPRPRMFEPPQPSILVILSEVGSVAHDRSRAVERSLPAPQPMWGGHSCPPTYESSRTTWGQPPSPCPERSRRRCPPSDAGGSASASVLARATRTGGHWLQPCRKAPTPNPSADEAQLFEPGAQVWRGRPRPRMYEPPPAPHPCHLERSGIGRSRPIPRSRKIPTRTTTPCWADTPSRQKAAGVPRFLRALCARGGRWQRPTASTLVCLFRRRKLPQQCLQSRRRIT